MTKPAAASPRLTAADLDKLKHYMIENIARVLEGESLPMENRRSLVSQRLAGVYEQTKLQLPDDVRNQLFKDVLDELLGYGPIQPLLEDDEISEIMVNGPKKVYIEKGGQLVKTPITFEDDAHVIRVIERIVLPLGRRIDADNATVDARLPDGSRVNAVIPPVAIDGPSLTIRKFRKHKLSMQQLIEYNSISPGMSEFLRACVLARLNIVVSGGTGTGKTVLLNALSSYIPESERIVTIEDAAELQLQQDHIMRMETRPPNSDGQGERSVRDLVRNALRMRPDRIVVGEVRGGEALDMLQAMNTGHDGSLTTLHSNSPRDAIARLETMIMMGGLDLPLKVVRQQISSAVDLIVQLSRLRDGTRKVTAITEVAGMEGETIVLTDIFKFQQSGLRTDGTVEGELKATGIRPLFAPRIEAAGIKLGAEIYGVTAADMQQAARQRR
jgi:pilus assembly protein CpaF